MVFRSFLFRREDILDVEVSASGFTKRMDKELLAQLGLNESDEEEEDDDSSGDDDIEELREQVEVNMKFEEHQDHKVEGNEMEIVDEKCKNEEKIDSNKIDSSKKSSPTCNINSVSEITSPIEPLADEEQQNHSGTQKDGPEQNATRDHTNKSNVDEYKIEVSRDEKDDASRSTIADDLESEFDSQSLAGSRFDARSVTSASTIPPEVIRARVKSALEKRERTKIRVRNLAKGEASATSRKRRDNRQTIQESVGCTMWAD